METIKKRTRRQGARKKWLYKDRKRGDKEANGGGIRMMETKSL